MDEWLELSELVDRAQELIDMGLYKDATTLLDSFSALYPQDWEIHFLYSRIYLEQNQPEKAIPYLHKSLRIDKHNPDVLLSMFYAYSQMDQFKKASKFLLRAEKFHGDNEAVQSALIWYYTEINDFDGAIAAFEKALTMGTDNPETFRNGGIAYERTGQFENAETCFKTALQLNSQFDDVRDLLADHYAAMDEMQKCIDLYKDYLKESPNNIRTMSRLVFCLSQNNQVEEAIQCAESVIKLYPNSPVGYVDLAYVHLNNEALDKAIATADKALDVSPIDAEAYRVKGIALSEKENFDESESAFAKALSLEPENTEIMRDYYHFLRTVKKFNAMEKMVFAVIKLERPYCIEDYWFLADYYRENNQRLKAFHFLHKAYEGMPGEKELIPPMIEIMLDAGHVNYTLPFLLHYLEKSGWNEVMNQFARHKRLQNKGTQEFLRFLRFAGEDSSDFRSFLFVMYLKKFITYAAFAIALMVIAGIAVFSGKLFITTGIAIVCFFSTAWFAASYLTRKRLH